VKGSSLVVTQVIVDNKIPAVVSGFGSRSNRVAKPGRIHVKNLGNDGGGHLFVGDALRIDDQNVGGGADGEQVSAAIEDGPALSDDRDEFFLLAFGGAKVVIVSEYLEREEAGGNNESPSEQNERYDERSFLGFGERRKRVHNLSLEFGSAF
jgi:hypothetical protein